MERELLELLISRLGYARVLNIIMDIVQKELNVELHWRTKLGA